MYLCVGMYTCECRCPRSSDEGLRSPGVGVAGSCEWPEIGAGNQTQVFCCNSTSPMQSPVSAFFCKHFNEYLLNCFMGIFEILTIALPALPGWPWRGHTTLVSIFTQHLWNREKDKACDARAMNCRTAGASGCCRCCGSLAEAVGLHRIHSGLLRTVLVHWSDKWIDLEWFF